MEKIGLETVKNTLPQWEIIDDGKAIFRKFAFKDFNQAFGFMTRAALYAETKNHHPEWFNVYNRVEIKLTTHDADAITNLDFDFARFLDGLLETGF